MGECLYPDWLAELTLEDIDYRRPQSLYDPTCGSGAFLFSAIRRLAQQGLSADELVRFAIDNVVGTDIRPSPSPSPV
ncbi:MAG UNVERIFIED_CONTAM: N-6 DNA methylase [Anaerolineae bacterium]